MLTALNASRDSRVTKTDNKKNTFMALLKKMLDDGQRTRLGEDAELERLAAEAEGERFKETTTLLDGSGVEPYITGKE